MSFCSFLDIYQPFGSPVTIRVSVCIRFIFYFSHYATLRTSWFKVFEVTRLFLLTIAVMIMYIQMITVQIACVVCRVPSKFPFPSRTECLDFLAFSWYNMNLLP